MPEKFRKLGFKEDFLKSIREHGFTDPSEIQEKTIPLAFAGKDIIGGSATGSGKTLAFGAAILENAVKGEGIQALILTPTRELAEQVSKALIMFSKFKPLKIISVYGGVSIVPQMESLRDSDIVVGTPGRILDHLSRRTINLSKVRFLVLDEADRMLDMGFLDDVEKIIRECPKQRQTFLFSATISPEITRLAKNYMHNPVEVAVDNQVDPAKLKQFFYDAGYEKFSLLVHLLKEEKSNLVMVFTNTKHNADFIAHNLKAQGINAVPLHGNLAQNKRMRVLEEFHKRGNFVLVCTDVAARGLDIKNVSHVYNYDSPKNSTDYIHRIGRTARAGEEGKAIIILGDQDYENFRRIQQNPDLNIKQLDLPANLPRIFLERRERRHGGRPGGHRGGESRGFGGGRDDRRGGHRDYHRRDSRNEGRDYRRRDERRRW